MFYLIQWFSIAPFGALKNSSGVANFWTLRQFYKFWSSFTSALLVNYSKVFRQIVFFQTRKGVASEKELRNTG
jgi:hypothetical protein